MRTIIFDTESNGFLEEASRFWCSACVDVDGDNQRGEVGCQWLVDHLASLGKEETLHIIGHNIFGHDLPLMVKLLEGFSFNFQTFNNVPVKYTDTLDLSRRLNPYRALPSKCPSSVLNPVTGKRDKVSPHGLLAWGYRVGFKKLEVYDWRNGDPKVYLERALVDIEINRLTYLQLMKEMEEQAEAINGCKEHKGGGNYIASPMNAMRVGQKAFFLTCMMELAGVEFDYEKAKKALSYIKRYMGRLERVIRPHLPKVDVPASKLQGVPVRKFKASKDRLILSAHMEKWFKWYGYDAEWVNGSWRALKGGCVVHEDVSLLEAGWKPVGLFKKEADLYSVSDINGVKQMLMDDFGWKPFFWNVKREKVGRKYVDVNTTPKFQNGGELCPSLEGLGEKVFFVKVLLRWASLKHKAGLLETKNKEGGFLHNKRVLSDGKISARMSGLAHTRRWRHAGLVNIPRVSTFLGGRIRELFTCKENEDFINYDVSSGEAFIKAHEAHLYDDGEYGRKIQAKGYDEHAENAQAWFPDMSLEDGRRRAKVGGYALQYLCQPPTLASLLKCSPEESINYHGIYWRLNWGWKQANDAYAFEWSRENGRKYLFSRISGQILQTRSQHTLGSTQAQHALGFLMDYSLCLMDCWLGGVVWVGGVPKYHYKGHYVMLVLYVHDESSWIADKAISQEVLELGIRSVETASKHLGLKVQIGASGKVGRNWGDTH